MTDENQAEDEVTVEAEIEAVDSPEETSEDESSDKSSADDSSVEASEDETVEESPAEMTEDERRQSGRKGVKLNRLISSKITDGDSKRECYLHLVDISEGGIRINSDDPFPEDRTFQLEIGLIPFGTELATRKKTQVFPVRVVWSKSLVGGMVVSGLAFEGLDEEGESIVAAIMQGASPQGRRMHFRLNRVLGVELGQEGSEQWLYPLTLDLSVEGMRICLNESLEVGAKFPLKVFLEFELPTVQATAEVVWQEVMPSGRVQTGLKFEDLSERDAMAIKTYIDQCLQQDDSHKQL